MSGRQAGARCPSGTTRPDSKRDSGANVDGEYTTVIVYNQALLKKTGALTICVRERPSSLHGTRREPLQFFTPVENHDDFGRLRVAIAPCVFLDHQEPPTVGRERITVGVI